MSDPARHIGATDPVVLDSGAVRLRVEPALGGRVTSLQVAGHEVLWNDSSAGPLGWGAYPMAPFAGRLRNGQLVVDGRVHQIRRNDPPHGLHGTVFDRPWRVGQRTQPAAPTTSGSVERATGVDAAVVELVCELGEHWPYRGECRQRIAVSAGQVRIDLEVDAALEAFPVSLGWHPWFRTELDTGAPLEVQARLGARFQRGGDGLPTGELVAVGDGPFDDCFSGVEWPIRLSWGDELALTMASDCRYVVIYDEQPHGWCIEPQSAPPGDTPRERAAPGRPVRASVTLEWVPRDPGR